MYTLPGLILLIAYILMRPFDFVPALGVLPFLHIFFVLAVIGLITDLSRRTTKWIAGPHLPWVIGLSLWTWISVFTHGSGSLGSQIGLLISPALYFLIAHGVTDFRAFSRLAGVFLWCTIVVSAVCVYQGFQPMWCVGTPEALRDREHEVIESRPCTLPEECYGEDAEPGFRYTCEHVGPGDMHSIEGRVRYVGVLEDPNEASLAVSLGIPFAIGQYQRRRTKKRLMVLVVACVLCGIAVIMSKSRGGQLVFATVFAVYFISRYKWKGLILAALLALPVLLLGGRSDPDAAESTTGRLNVQWDGINMFLASPLLGVGQGQYIEHSVGTAHNSFILTPAELGLPGMVTWITTFWISFKAIISGLKLSKKGRDGELRTWGIAMLAALCGLVSGILFLSFNYHYVLWTMFGLSGAYYRSAIEAHPEIKIRIRAREVLLATAANLGLLTFLFFYIKSKGL